MTGFDIAMAGLLSFGQVIPSAQREIAQYRSLAGTRDAWESNAAMIVSLGGRTRASRRFVKSL